MPPSLAGRDLLSIADLTTDEILAILDLADAAKSGRDLGSPLAGRSLALIFQRPSNRTRVSFEVAIHSLGGHPIALFNPEMQLGERESAADISSILDRYADGIVARLVSQRDLVTIAGAATSPVINALTDAEHPCQVLADCMTVRSVTGRLAGATVAYIGDGNNVCTSWIYAAALLGVHLRIICPPRLRATPGRASTGPPASARRAPASRSPTRRLRRCATPTSSTPTCGRAWARNSSSSAAARTSRYLQVNDSLVALAPAGVRVMHCLPAHRGEEITDAVIDGPQLDRLRPGGEPPLGPAGAARPHLRGRRRRGRRMSDLLRNAHFFLQSLSWRDGLDVLVVAFLLYQLLKLIRGTQAVQLLLGLGGHLRGRLGGAAAPPPPAPVHLQQRHPGDRDRRDRPVPARAAPRPRPGRPARHRSSRARTPSGAGVRAHGRRGDARGGLAGGAQGRARSSCSSARPGSRTSRPPACTSTAR